MIRSRQVVLGMALCMAIAAGLQAQQFNNATTPLPQLASDNGHQSALGISLHETDNQVRVSGIQADSPAARANLRIGDEITAIDTAGIKTTGQFIAEIVKRQPGTFVNLKIRRDGQVQTIQAKLVTLDSLRALRASAENQRMNRQIRALQRKVSLLEQVARERSPGNQDQAPALRGNGDNSWYYQTEPDDPNQGIHDYGAAARDGQ